MSVCNASTATDKAQLLAVITCRSLADCRRALEDAAGDENQAARGGGRKHLCSRQSLAEDRAGQRMAAASATLFGRKPRTTHRTVTTRVREHTSSRPPKPQVVQECQSAERKGAQAAAPKGRTAGGVRRGAPSYPWRWRCSCARGCPASSGRRPSRSGPPPLLSFLELLVLVLELAVVLP